jgi:hypothetical protein
VIGVHYQSADRWLRDFSTAYIVLVSTPYSYVAAVEVCHDSSK